jgi:hypothetical protein
LISQLATKHGHARNCLTMSSEYRAWAAMRGRCLVKTHTEYENYGGRGIAIDPRWDEFNTFLFDMGPKPTPRHTLDRIDVNGNYTPSNCRWATRGRQANNARTNHRIEAFGRNENVTTWAGMLGMHNSTLCRQLKNLSPSEALSHVRLPGPAWIMTRVPAEETNSEHDTWRWRPYELQPKAQANGTKPMVLASSADRRCASYRRASRRQADDEARADEMKRGDTEKPRCADDRPI